MKSNPSPNQDPEARLPALLRAAASAPLPPAAERLAIGFGQRAEARVRAVLQEESLVEQLLRRWLIGMAAGTALVVLAVGLSSHFSMNNSTVASNVADFQSAWSNYTAVPEIWPVP